jgi:hypothetical protein
MKSFLALIAVCFCSLSGFIIASADDVKDFNTVGQVQIVPFFPKLPEFEQPIYPGNNKADAKKNFILAYRACARASMKDGVNPVHSLIRRLARRNITIAFENPGTYEELIRDPNNFIDVSVDSARRGVAVKDSLKATHMWPAWEDPFAKGKSILFHRVAREECIQILGEECVAYLDEVKKCDTPLWHAVRGNDAQARLSSLGGPARVILSGSRRSSTHRGFLLPKDKSYQDYAQVKDDGSGVDRSVVRAKQHAALLSIMRVAGEAVVQKCKEEIVREWLQAYENEDPLGIFGEVFWAN